jgi:hypothetical protein
VDSTPDRTRLAHHGCAAQPDPDHRAPAHRSARRLPRPVARGRVAWLSGDGVGRTRKVERKQALEVALAALGLVYDDVARLGDDDAIDRAMAFFDHGVAELSITASRGVRGRLRVILEVAAARALQVGREQLLTWLSAEVGGDASTPPARSRAVFDCAALVCHVTGAQRPSLLRPRCLEVAGKRRNSRRRTRPRSGSQPSGDESDGDADGLATTRLVGSRNRGGRS